MSVAWSLQCNLCCWSPCSVLECMEYRRLNHRNWIVAKKAVSAIPIHHTLQIISYSTWQSMVHFLLTIVTLTCRQISSLGFEIETRKTFASNLINVNWSSVQSNLQQVDKTKTKTSFHYVNWLEHLAWKRLNVQENETFQLVSVDWPNCVHWKSILVRFRTG